MNKIEIREIIRIRNEMELFTIEQFSLVFNEKMIDYLLSNKKEPYCAQVLVKIPHIKNGYQICENPKIIQYYLDKENWHGYFANYDIDFSKAIIDYIINLDNPNEYLHKIALLNEEHLYTLLNNDTLGTLVIKNADINLLLNKLPHKLVEHIFSNTFYPSIIINFFKQANLSDYFVISDNNSHNFIIPSEVLNNVEFQNIFLGIINPNYFNKILNYLEVNHLDFARKLAKKKDSLYDEEVNNIKNGILPSLLNLTEEELKQLFKDNQIISYLSPNTIINKHLKEISNKLFNQIISYRFFKDCYGNLVEDLTEIVYYSISHPDLIDPKHIEIYNTLIYLNDLDIEEKIEFYNLLNGTDYLQMVYDDSRKCKDSSYEEIKKCLITKDGLEKNELLSNINNVDVYELNGIDFYALIHANRRVKKSESKGLEWEDKNITYPISSFSLIDNNQIDKVICNPHEHIVYGFNSINTDRIMHVSNQDGFTNIYGSNYINRIMSPEELSQTTYDGFNEILCLNNPNKPIKPDYILVYDTITKYDINTAQSLNIPIVLLHTRAYRKSKDNDYKEEYVTYSTDITLSLKIG